MEENYDLIIVGAGPAGLTAGIYAARYLLKTLILGEIKGGTITEAYKVCNFPSENEIEGFQLGLKMVEQNKILGTEIKQEKVEQIKKQKNKFKIKTNKKAYLSKKLILATGRKKQKLNVSGEEDFLGKGVSYCATCDAAFFKDKIVGVIGGSNTALTAALFLSKYAEKVYIFYRRGKFFRAEPSWIKQVGENEKIETILNSNVKEIMGNEKVEKLKLDNGKEIEIDGIFIEIGYFPDEKLSKQLNLETEAGYIKVNKRQETSVSGLYAAGDITNNSLKQVITACGEGAIAANSAYEELSKK